MARLLILTLSSGEAALPVLLRQLTTQSFRDFEHEVISGLPNQAAHNRLYRTIMARASSFDLFLKLDADMTLRSDTALADAIRATDAHRGRLRGGLPQKSHKYFRHMRNCARIRDLSRSTHARRHQLALIGVMWAMRHRDISSVAQKAQLQEIFETEICAKRASWFRRVERLSTNLLGWRLALLRSL